MMKFHRSNVLGGMYCLAARCAGLTLLALAITVDPTFARPQYDSHACRQATEAMIKGDVEAAVAALNPGSPVSEELRENLMRITETLAGAFKNKPGRLERTLPDISVETYPTSLQIWSFGDREVYFVGCLIRKQERDSGFLIEIRPSVDLIVQQMKAKLASN